MSSNASPIHELFLVRQVRVETSGARRVLRLVNAGYPAGDQRLVAAVVIRCYVAAKMDGLSRTYEDLLAGTYDCLDRIVLNAYFRVGHDAASCACERLLLEFSGNSA
jgi:hypothetical protein